MQNIINVIFGFWLWIKAIAFWLMIKENRRIGIMNTKKALDVFTFVSKLTKNKRDDLAAAYVAKQFAKAFESEPLGSNGVKSVQTAIVDAEAATNAANEVTKSQKGLLKDVSIALNNGKVKAGIGNVVSEYNPSNGNVKFGIDWD